MIAVSSFFSSVVGSMRVRVPVKPRYSIASRASSSPSASGSDAMTTVSAPFSKTAKFFSCFLLYELSSFLPILTLSVVGRSLKGVGNIGRDSKFHGLYFSS